MGRRNTRKRFYSRGIIPKDKRGTREDKSYITAWDWYASYAFLAKQNPQDDFARAAKLPPIDSVNVIGYLLGQNSTIPRNYVIIGDTSAIAPNQAGSTLVGGLIVDNFKILVGAKSRSWEINQYVITGPEWPNKTSHGAVTS